MKFLKRSQIIVLIDIKLRFAKLQLELIRNINTLLCRIRDCLFLGIFHKEKRSDGRLKISIIIPTLSRGVQADHLGKLRELLSRYLPEQSYKNYEAIVFCDGPNEEVANMVTSLKDDRIRLYSSAVTIGKWGHPQTRMGIEKATGQFFVRMNDDNVPYRHYLHTLVSNFEESIGIVYGRVIFKGEARKRHMKYSVKRSFIFPDGNVSKPARRNIDCMCYMVRMELAKKYINYFNDEFCADWIFLKHMLKDDVKARFVDRIIGEKF